MIARAARFNEIPVPFLYVYAPLSPFSVPTREGTTSSSRYTTVRVLLGEIDDEEESSRGETSTSTQEWGRRKIESPRPL